MAAKETNIDSDKTGNGVDGPRPWVYVLMVVTLYWAINYLDAHSGGFNAKVYAPHRDAVEVASLKVEKTPEEQAFESGARLYRGVCAACHQPNGMGNDNAGFPPLVNSEWVLSSSPDRIIAIVSNGLQGPVDVAGKTYNKIAMPAQGVALSNQDIAAVLSYIRSNSDWGDAHNLPMVTPEKVKAVRDTIADRSAAWTADDLKQQFPESQ
jgi:mono/diheme cytochrome c family protein